MPVRRKPTTIPRVIYRSAGAMCKALLLDGAFLDEEIHKRVSRKFPTFKYAEVSWWRYNLRSSGKNVLSAKELRDKLARMRRRQSKVARAA